MDALLSGLLFDDAGNRMTATYTKKKGIQYRYYISHSILQSRRNEAGSVARVPATDIEAAVIEALKQRKIIRQADVNLSQANLRATVERITILESELKIELLDKSIGKNGAFLIPWEKPSSVSPKGLVHAPTSARCLSQESRQSLLTAISRARNWMNDLVSGSVTNIDGIARREGNVERHIRLLLPLAFASPATIESIAGLTADPHLTVTGLAKQIPLEWENNRITPTNRFSA